MLSAGPETPVETPAEAAEPLSDTAEVAESAVADPAPALEEVADPPTDAADDLDAQRGYEPAALDMGQYTCDDCVYVATCPKHHQDSPSTCGSFQWKSV